MDSVHFILGRRVSAIAARAAGRRRSNGRGGRRSNDIGCRDTSTSASRASDFTCPYHARC